MTAAADLPPGTIALATVHGVRDVLVLRRDCGHGLLDWAHTLTAGVTCSHDEDVTIQLVIDLEPGIGEITTLYTTRAGRVLSPTEIKALADEAERGYDVSQLPRNSRANP